MALIEEEGVLTGSLHLYSNIHSTFQPSASRVPFLAVEARASAAHFHMVEVHGGHITYHDQGDFSMVLCGSLLVPVIVNLTLRWDIVRWCLREELRRRGVILWLADHSLLRMAAS
ncbi:hypothetical protein H5410_026159 [Solanum commersonii]|uniref:Uncharacterized protein n=1 Tax=Solanum commersonii TaxID=4109 RepID=A0A9J5YV97_SOLCO|nr:hypothetical protein H5410_026159 [Solanum commersonii]